MKHLLFLSFLLNTACVDILKSMLEDPEEEEDEDEDDERREGTRQGDCTDGEDNDDDGDIDCNDSGCYDKPACDGDTAVLAEASDEPSDEPSDEASFYGEIVQSFDFEAEYEEQGYDDCSIQMIVSPSAGSVSDASSCSGCTVFGKAQVEIETDCTFYESGVGEWDLAVNTSTETLYNYSPDDNQWISIFDSSSCNNYFSSSISDSYLTIECGFQESGAYSSDSYLSISW